MAYALTETEHAFHGIGQTGAVMRKFVIEYAGDIGHRAKWGLRRFHRFVSELPYIRDPDRKEALSRPLASMSRDAYFRDCDDKAILIGSWCWLNAVPFRFVACAYRPGENVGHVVVEISTDYGMDIIDATYPGTPYPRKQDFFKLTPICQWTV